MRLVGVEEQLAVGEALLEEVVVVGHLGEHEGVERAVGHDAGVPVHGEHLLPTPALGLEHAREDVEGEVHHVVRFGRVEHREEVHQLGLGHGAVAPHEPQELYGVEVDLLDAQEQVEPVLQQVLDVPELGATIDREPQLRQGELGLRERVGVHGHGLERDATAPAVGHRADGAREQGREHRVVDARGRELRGDVGLRDLFEHLRVLPEHPQRRLRRSVRGGEVRREVGRHPNGRGRAEQGRAEVMHHHEGHPQPEAQERIVPAQGAHPENGLVGAGARHHEPAEGAHLCGRERREGGHRGEEADSISAARPRRSNVG